MALQTDFTRDVFGESMTFKNCYFRIVRIMDYSKDDGCCFDVNIYRNKDLSDNRSEAIYSLGFRFSYNSENNSNVLEECYNYLKSLPEFEGSVDV